ncbi:transcriptional regulator prz1 [Podospora fimiseda]|uniref:Transcriptional regulator prz1 n=1 Tax=Podospora fimiseda TaxID=252190 RepID=A0AAN7H772_9PEZI|nr:transcriptional regulator prz1 [Podospora fimiseda]
MASNRGPTATEAPRAIPTALSTTTTTTPTSPDLARQNSLKRARETTPTAHESVPSGDFSPSKIARLIKFASQSHPNPHPNPPLTGAAALEEERRRREEEHQQHQQLAVLEASENPSQRAIEELMSGVANAISRSQDAPAPGVQEASSAAVEAAARAFGSVTIPTGEVAAGELQDVSPQSGTTGDSLENPDIHVVHSPITMDIDSRGEQRLYAPQPDAQMEDKSAAASLSYPGPIPPQNPNMPGSAPPQRGMSMPMTSSQNSELGPRSPSSKKHKCPYCETEFTRHHNLKSHLLTHSQEKPYVCASCQMRFRRLHDLKRHNKLHTGEKPHTCPKCDRKFARGDALARHSKGAGGCAGRRPSMGGFAGEEDFDGANGADDSAMSGVLYDGTTGAEMSEEDRRRLSMPTIKAQHVAGQAAGEGYTNAHSNTYPPAGQRPGGLYPPNVDRGSVNNNTAGAVPNNHVPHPGITSLPMTAGSSSMYSQSAMTESPKPLSPGGHQRPPNDQQQTASGLSLPTHGMSPAAKQAWLSQYPPADRDATKGNAIAPGPQQAAGRIRGRAPSGAAQAAAQGGNAVDGNLFTTTAGDPSYWAYVQQHFEERLKAMHDETQKSHAQLLEKLNLQEQQIAALTAEVTALRQHHIVEQHQLADSSPDAALEE